MATIKDVANLARVSVATVSRVLNAPDTVKESTRIQVNSAIEELQYSPNLLGRNLRRLETRRILVLLDSISNQFYSRVVRGIEDKAREHDFTVMICTVRDSKKHFMDHMKMLKTRTVDGAIIMCGEIAPEELVKFNQSYPLVCACEPIPNTELTSVSIDDYRAGLDATNYLIGLGKRRIAALGTPRSDNDCGSAKLRFSGFCDAMAQHDLPIEPALIFDEGYTYNSGRRSIKRLLVQKSLPDAIFSFSDAGAIGAVRELGEHGIRVPDDISVMGFDNTAISEMYQPSITTVSQPQYEIGSKAMELLLNKINGSPQEASVYLEHRIICRESVK